MKSFIFLLCTGFLITGLAQSVEAEPKGSYASTISRVQDVEDYPRAIKGYDPVAYFEEGEPLKGDNEIYFIYRGQKWHFANHKNEKLFTEDPAQYVPQYAGYCAFAVSQGALAPSNPKVWSIVDGRLFLNVNDSVQKKWEANQKQYIELADQKWPALEKQLP